MENPVPKKTMFLVPPLPLVEEDVEKDKSTDTIEFMLKQRAGATAASAPAYKLKVHRFCEGTVEAWIRVRKAMTELWTQNSMTSASDRVATVQSILRGDSLTVFEASIEELTHVTDEDGDEEILPLSEEIVQAALEAVAVTVFPFRALNTQKQWMRRGFRKPKDLPIRKTVAAVSRLNNSIPYFPSGSETDKFSKEELVELLEWSIPQAWRTKFDLDGYIPTAHSKEYFMTQCEQIERNEATQKTVKSTQFAGTKRTAHKKDRGSKHKHGKTKSYSDKAEKFYCTEHGKNSTHNTEGCYTLKNRGSKQGNASAHLTKKTFRREINALSRGRDKKEVLEMFATVIRMEALDLDKKKKPSAKKQSVESNKQDFESDESEDEIHVMDTDDGQTVDLTDEGQTVEGETGSEAVEEQTFQKQIENLGTLFKNK